MFFVRAPAPTVYRLGADIQLWRRLDVFEVDTVVHRRRPLGRYAVQLHGFIHHFARHQGRHNFDL